MTKEQNNTNQKIKHLKTKIAVTAGLTVGVLATNHANAQEISVKHPSANNFEQVSQKTQKNDYLYSNAEKLFDMYRLAYNDDTKFNMIDGKEKSKCQTFFNKHPDLKRKCNEVDVRLKNNRGMQGFNNAELIYRREGDDNLRAEILEKLAKDPKILAEMNKIEVNVTDFSAAEQQTAHIWSMYVAVETGNPTQAYKKFFDQYPNLYENCAAAADKAGITKEMLPVTSIADPNAELLLSGAESLTDQLTKTMDDYRTKTGKTVKIPSSTYQVTATDFSR